MAKKSKKKKVNKKINKKLKTKLKNIIQKLPKGLQVCLIAGSILLYIFLALILIYHFLFWQKIYPGVKVANLDLSARDVVKATNILKQASLKQEKTLKLNWESQSWEINLDSFDFSYLPQAAGRQAFLIGRSGNWQQDIKEKIQGLRKKVNLDFDYQINKELLQTSIASISSQINVPAIPPEIKLIQGGQVSKIEIQAGQSGRELEKDKLTKLINHQLGQLLEPNIDLPVKQILPEINPGQIEKAKVRAEKLLGKSLALSFEENTWKIEEKELINFIDFDQDFDQEKIASFAAQLAQSIDRPAQNALFNFANGRVTEFKPAKDGQKLDQQQTKELINQKLKELEDNGEKIVHIALPVGLSQPEVANEDVNNLGIKQLIGRGESWFYGSIASRIHNVKLASSLINGILIAPGETFSLTEALGDISLQTGFQQAWIIKEGRTVLGDGGGVCQVSTTLFRAALKAGLPIVERRAHAYRVGYYEQNYQVGIDATVFAPSPDFKFKNDTPGHILIQTYVDTANMKATYNLYGTADGRQVYISPSRIWDQSPPPPDLYQDDPTLPNGVVKQIDWAAWGAKTAFDWKVTRNNEVLQEKTFYSSYKPWQAIFLKGTGG